MPSILLLYCLTAYINIEEWELSFYQSQMLYAHLEMAYTLFVFR